MRTVAVAYVSEVIVVVHSSKAPSDEDWARYLDAVKAHAHEARGQVVVSYGGSPNAAQRTLGVSTGKDALKGRAPPPTAVMTASALVRSVVTFFNWIFPQRYKSFALADYAGVATHLALSPSAIAAIEAQVQQLRASLTQAA